MVSDLGIAVASIFAAVILSGALSGIITLGLVELFTRSGIQRAAVGRTLRSGFDGGRPGRDTSGDMLAVFVREKYDASSSPELTKSVDAYIAKLGEVDFGTAIMPYLLGLPEKTLYRLHYRQLCGQIMAAVSRESIMASEQQAFTPVIDLLAFLSRGRGWVLDGPTSDTAEPSEPDIKRAERLRRDVDSATREIDQLQAGMSEAISGYAFYCSFGIWLFAFILIVGSALDRLNMASASSSLLERMAGGVVALVSAGILSLILAFAAAVVASIVFAWLDRGFSSK